MPRPKTQAAPSPDLGVTPSFAAQYLASQLGHSAELWNYRLANWRKPGRRCPLPWTTTEAGHPTYALSALEKFVEEQRASQVVLDAAADHERPRAGATPVLDGKGVPHIRLSVAIGQMGLSVFALDPQTARKLADHLNRSATIVEAAQIA